MPAFMQETEGYRLAADKIVTVPIICCIYGYPDAGRGDLSGLPAAVPVTAGVITYPVVPVTADEITYPAVSAERKNGKMQ